MSKTDKCINNEIKILNEHIEALEKELEEKEKEIDQLKNKQKSEDRKLLDELFKKDK